MQALQALEDANDPFLENECHDVRLKYIPRDLKTWPSTLDYIDTHCDGFYGMTTLAAEKGTGKTLLAIASAIEAAATGEWQVVYFAAEDDYDGFRTRFNQYLHEHPGAADCLTNFFFHSVGRSQSPLSITRDTQACVDRHKETPILIVFDSINSIVTLSGRPYLQALSELGVWAMLARRLSGGNVSFLITAETNKRGEAKGEALPFWSDCYLKLKKVKGSENVVEIILDKTRRTAGEGPMGKFLRNWQTGRFERDRGAAAPFRVVQGGGSPYGD